MRVQPLQGIVMILVLSLLSTKGFGQRYLSDYDSTLFIRDTVRPFLKRMENLHFSGYIQPQFQVAQAKGAPSYEGGNFSEFSNSRFMLRRARLKVDYIFPAKGKDFPQALFTFQFDASERGVFVRDMFLRLYEPKGEKLSFTMGLFARPFGFEVNLSSAYRESPERGRMSQILMPTERDLGAMASFESKKSSKPLFKLDIGVFNGPGLSATTDFDSYKDIISRFTLKPYKLSKQFSISAGLSLLYGGWMEATRYKYETQSLNGNKAFVVDSSLSNIGAKAPRHYYGADVQLVYKHAWGKTELRGEYWKGKQPGTAGSTTNPGALPTLPTYIREFDGAFFYFIQNIVNSQWEVIAKYDWYDPNIKVSERDLQLSNTPFTVADIKFSTFGIGLTHYFNDHVKLIAYYDMVHNEKSSLTGFTGDAKDDIFTLRAQFRF
jgi:hypothetical protein